MTESTRFCSVVLLAAVEVLATCAHLADSQGTGPGAAMSAALLIWAAFRLVTAKTKWWPVRDTVVAAIYVLATPWLVDGPEFAVHASPMLVVGGTAVVAMAIACPPLRSLPAAVVIMACWAFGSAHVPGIGNPLAIFNLDFVIVE